MTLKQRKCFCFSVWRKKWEVIIQITKRQLTRTKTTSYMHICQLLYRNECIYLVTQYTQILGNNQMYYLNSVLRGILYFIKNIFIGKNKKLELHSLKVLLYAYFLAAQYFSQLMDKKFTWGAMSRVTCLW